MSPRRRRLATTFAVAAVAAPLGVAAELVAYDGAAASDWAPDLAVGWGLVVCGLVVVWRGMRSRSGPLLCASGLAWFAGNFAYADVPVVRWVGEHGVYVHRAFLASAVLAVAFGGRLSPPRRAVIAAAFVVALWPALATSDAAWVVLAAAVLVAGVTTGDPRVRPGAIAFALAVGGVAAVRLLDRPVDPDTLLHLYEAGLLVTGAALVLVVRRPSASAVADRVVELGEAATVCDALRRLLGDPSLELAFLRDGSYIDERGRLLAPPSSAARRVTALGPSGETVVVHDEAVPIDVALADAISRALRLTTENARLQADALDQLEELRASRRRLVLSRGRQRALLARRLREGAERRLRRIDASLARIDTADDLMADAVARARREVGEARDGIAALALGLQPPLLASEGLAGALGALAARSSVPVSVSADGRRFDAGVEHAAYLVCAEALTNVAKHSGASRAVVHVSTHAGRLLLEIDDDGRGGADPRGSGMLGLEERVEELGGILRVESPPGSGTRISAEIPLRTEGDVPETEQSALDARYVPAPVGVRS